MFKIEVQTYCNTFFIALVFVFSFPCHHFYQSQRSRTIEHLSSTIKNGSSSSRNLHTYHFHYEQFRSYKNDRPSATPSEDKTSQQIKYCKNWQFPCKNGQCIDKTYVCDGILHCQDKSDESYVQCQNKSCDEQHFQCHYGACIDVKYRCDGFNQCWDKSDELSDECDVITSEPIKTRMKQSVNGSCPVSPLSTPDKTVLYTCPAISQLNNCTSQEGYVFNAASVEVTCNPDHFIQVENTIENRLTHICRESKWLPDIKKCQKKCDTLNPGNSDLWYYKNGSRIPKNGNSVILAGTQVRQWCKPGFRFQYPPYTSKNTCGDDGKWDTSLVPCVPECGVSSNNVETLIYGGAGERHNGSPWHVAIYRNVDKVLICGGTIISEHVVLSAASCFSKGDNYSTVNDFQIVVGKHTRNYTTIDNNYQHTHNIKEIRFSPQHGYHGLRSNYAADLAILILKEKINISPAVLPACIDWNKLKSDTYPSEGTFGKVVGWGVTKEGKLSEVLKSINIPFISNRRCLALLHDDAKAFLTPDKFCAGTGNATGEISLEGDGGGGLLFKKDNIFYLRGIASIKQYHSNAVVLFTDIGQYSNWIESVRDEAEGG